MQTWHNALWHVRIGLQAVVLTLHIHLELVGALPTAAAWLTGHVATMGKFAYYHLS